MIFLFRRFLVVFELPCRRMRPNLHPIGTRTSPVNVGNQLGPGVEAEQVLALLTVASRAPEWHFGGSVSHFCFHTTCSHLPGRLGGLNESAEHLQEMRIHPGGVASRPSGRERRLAARGSLRCQSHDLRGQSPRAAQSRERPRGRFLTCPGWISIFSARFRRSDTRTDRPSGCEHVL